MVWPYMGFGEYMEIYSGYDPAWRFAHCPDYWIQELTDEGILASAGELSKVCHSALSYVRNGRSTSICATSCPM